MGMGKLGLGCNCCQSNCWCDQFIRTNVNATGVFMFNEAAYGFPSGMAALAQGAYSPRFYARNTLPVTVEQNGTWGAPYSGQPFNVRYTIQTPNNNQYVRYGCRDFNSPGYTATGFWSWNEQQPTLNSVFNDVFERNWQTNNTNKDNSGTNPFGVSPGMDSVAFFDGRTSGTRNLKQYHQTFTSQPCRLPQWWFICGLTPWVTFTSGGQQIKLWLATHQDYGNTFTIWGSAETAPQFRFFPGFYPAGNPGINWLYLVSAAISKDPSNPNNHILRVSYFGNGIFNTYTEQRSFPVCQESFSFTHTITHYRMPQWWTVPPVTVPVTVEMGYESI